MVDTGASPPNDSIRVKTVGTHAYEVLRQRILDGTLQEGMALRQAGLAVGLGVSRIPIREALKQLEAEGLVIFKPHSGATVAPLRVSEIEELFSLRALIETDLLVRAVGHLSPEDLERARKVLEVYEEAFKRRDVAVWGRLNWEFHSALYSVALRPFTTHVLELLHAHCERYARVQLALTRWEARAMEEHRQLLELVREEDVKGAQSLLATHILSAGESLAALLRESRSGMAHEKPLAGADEAERGDSSHFVTHLSVPTIGSDKAHLWKTRG